MGINLFEAPTEAFTAKLDGRFTSSDTTMVLTTTTGLSAPGVVIVERIDTNGFASPQRKEACSFTGISGDALTGVTRALAGTTAIDHESGARVEAYLSVDHWNDLRSTISVEHNTTTGEQKWETHVQNFSVTGVSGASGLRGDILLSATGNATMGSVSGVSGFSAVLIDLAPYNGGIPPFFYSGGLASGSTNITPIMIIEDQYYLRYVSAALRYPASGASVVLDVNLGGTSIFNTATQPSIAGGGTYVSTASIATKTLAPGNLLTLDVDMCNQAGDLTVVLGV